MMISPCAWKFICLQRPLEHAGGAKNQGASDTGTFGACKVYVFNGRVDSILVEMPMPPAGPKNSASSVVTSIYVVAIAFLVGLAQILTL
jgi:hypothetical protein